MSTWVNFKIERQFIIFVIILLSLHLTFRFLDWPGGVAWLIVIPFIFSLVNLSIFIGKGISKSHWDFKYILIVLLYFMFSLKVEFSYYNIIFPILLVALSFYIVRFKEFMLPNLKQRLTFLIVLNIVIIITPDILLFEYIHSEKSKIWGNKLKWIDFKGIEPQNIDKMDARIDSEIYWKFNNVYNIPQFITLAVMEKSGSWVNPEANHYEGNLLRHEQLHFDITEWTRREFHDSMSNCDKIDFAKANEIYYHFQTVESQRQSDYDSISKHGVDFNGQIKWNKKVKQKLN